MWVVLTHSTEVNVVDITPAIYFNIKLPIHQLFSVSWIEARQGFALPCWWVKIINEQLPNSVERHGEDSRCSASSSAAVCCVHLLGTAR